MAASQCGAVASSLRYVRHTRRRLPRWKGTHVRVELPPHELMLELGAEARDGVQTGSRKSSARWPCS